MELTWRSLTEDDIPTWAELLVEIEQVDRSGNRVGVPQLTGLFASGVLDPVHNSIAAFAGERLVATGLIPVRPPSERMQLLGRVHPDWRNRGIGSALLDWLVDRARQIPTGLPVELYVTNDDANTRYRDLLASRGFQPVRHFASMEADLAHLPPSPALPDGLRLVDFTEQHDEAARVAHNEVFQDHWGDQSISPQEWRHRFTGSATFRPELSPLLLAESTGEVVAFVLSHQHEDHVVELDSIGTRRSWRGHGLASGLIGHVLARARAQGYRRAGLGVDTQNASGALAIYQRAGFRIIRRSTVFTTN